MNSAGDRKSPYALKASEGRVHNLGVDFTVKASEVQQGSGSAVLEYVTRKGEEPPDHTHRTEDEMFYVLEGAISFHCAGKTFDLEKGGFVFLPRGIKHGYTIKSDGDVRLLVITSPTRDDTTGGWGGFVSDMELADARK
jgi:quercetin dioxygenase-like cupin family protein